MLCHGRSLIEVTALQTWQFLFSFSHWVLVKLMVRVFPHDSPQLRYVGNAFFLVIKNIFLSITLNIHYYISFQYKTLWLDIHIAYEDIYDLFI